MHLGNDIFHALTRLVVTILFSLGMAQAAQP